jgi:hypothetical protein
MSYLAPETIKTVAEMLKRKATLEEMQSLLKTKTNSVIKIQLYELAINDQLSMADVRDWGNLFLPRTVKTTRGRKERPLRVSSTGTISIPQKRLQNLGLTFNPRDEIILEAEGASLVIRPGRRHVPGAMPPPLDVQPASEEDDDQFDSQSAERPAQPQPAPVYSETAYSDHAAPAPVPPTPTSEPASPPAPEPAPTAPSDAAATSNVDQSSTTYGWNV